MKGWIWLRRFNLTAWVLIKLLAWNWPSACCYSKTLMRFCMLFLSLLLIQMSSCPSSLLIGSSSSVNASSPSSLISIFVSVSIFPSGTENDGGRKYRFSKSFFVGNVIWHSSSSDSESEEPWSVLSSSSSLYCSFGRRLAVVCLSCPSYLIFQIFHSHLRLLSDQNCLHHPLVFENLMKNFLNLILWKVWGSWRAPKC